MEKGKNNRRINICKIKGIEVKGKTSKWFEGFKVFGESCKDSLKSL